MFVCWRKAEVLSWGLPPWSGHPGAAPRGCAQGSSPQQEPAKGPDEPAESRDTGPAAPQNHQQRLEHIVRRAAVEGKVRGGGTVISSKVGGAFTHQWALRCVPGVFLLQPSGHKTPTATLFPAPGDVSAWGRGACSTSPEGPICGDGRCGSAFSPNPIWLQLGRSVGSSWSSTRDQLGTMGLSWSCATAPCPGLNFRLQPSAKPRLAQQPLTFVFSY